MASRENITTKALLKMYAVFVEQLGIPKPSVFVNPITLLDASKHYWRDVDRLHSSHGIEHIDCHKIAGYLTYWISKLKPISILDASLYSPKHNELLLNINEYFAFYVAIGRICDDRRKSGKGTTFLSMTAAFIESFVYTMKYRATTGDNLSLMYYLLEECSK